MLVARIKLGKLQGLKVDVFIVGLCQTWRCLEPLIPNKDAITQLVAHVAESLVPLPPFVRQVYLRMAENSVENEPLVLIDVEHGSSEGPICHFLGLILLFFDGLRVKVIVIHDPLFVIEYCFQILMVHLDHIVGPLLLYFESLLQKPVNSLALEIETAKMSR